jgi:hypothetical protein
MRATFVREVAFRRRTVPLYRLPSKTDCWKCGRRVLVIGWPYKDIPRPYDVNCERCIQEQADFEWDDAA